VGFVVMFSIVMVHVVMHHAMVTPHHHRVVMHHAVTHMMAHYHLMMFFLNLDPMLDTRFAHVAVGHRIRKSWSSGGCERSSSHDNGEDFHLFSLLGMLAGTGDLAALP
jgi:hypothetical protein